MSVKLQKLLLCATLLLVVVSFAACSAKEGDPEKMAFNEVLDNTNSEQVKTVSSDMNVGVVCYDSAGKAGKINEQLKLDRCTDGSAYFTEGTMATSPEPSGAFASVLNTLFGLMGTNNVLGTLKKYFNGAVYFAGRAGLYNDTVNGQVEICEKGKTPEYKFEDDGSNILALKSAWGAIKYSDFNAFKESFGVKTLTDADLLEMYYSAFSMPIDWSTVADSANASYVNFNGERVVEYDLLYTAPEVKAYARETVEKYLKEIWGEFPEEYALVKAFYDDIADTVFEEMVSFSDLRVVARVNKDNRLVSMDTDIIANGMLTDDNVLTICEAWCKDIEGGELTSGNRGAINIVLTAAHGILGCSTTEEKKFEGSVIFSLKDTYVYEATMINLSSDIFKSIDEDIPARATGRWVASEEDGEYDWDLKFPQKVEDFFYGDNSSEEDDESDGDEDEKGEEEGKDVEACNRAESTYRGLGKQIEV